MKNERLTAMQNRNKLVWSGLVRISLPFLNFIEYSSRRRMLPGKRERSVSFCV